jgi:hypothetical protein
MYGLLVLESIPGALAKLDREDRPIYTPLMANYKREDRPIYTPLMANYKDQVGNMVNSFRSI